MTNNYRLGHHEVEARQFDGTDKNAEELAEWIRDEGGEVQIIKKGKSEYDPHRAFLVLTSINYDRLVRQNFWVVQVDDKGTFYGVYPDVFENMYEPLIEVSTRDEVS